MKTNRNKLGTICIIPQISVNDDLENVLMEIRKIQKNNGSLTIFAFPIQRCLPRCSNYLKNNGASTTGSIKNQFVAKIVKEPK